MVAQDSDLVKKAKSGSKGAFDKLVEKYHKKVLYLAFDVVGNYEEAKDVAQEAFIRSYKNLHQFQEKAKFSTWLYRITVNCAMDYHRKRKRHPVDSIEDKAEYILRSKAENLVTKPVNTIIDKENRSHMEWALNHLSHNQRTATVLKFFQDKSTKEISEIMGCSEGTVRIHQFRAMKKLKTILKSDMLL